MSFRLVLKALFATLTIPGVVTIFFPWLIIGRPSEVILNEVPFFRWIALAFGFVGAAVLLHCIWGFAFVCKGTLASIAPPTALVVKGLYRCTRNPMYLAVTTVLLSEALLTMNLSLVVYAAVVFVCFHTFVVLYEEPHLRKQFGGQYFEYCRTIPRWGFSRRPYSP